MVTIGTQWARSRAGWMALVGVLLVWGWTVRDAHASRFAYVANIGTSTLNVMAVDPTTGTLSTVGNIASAPSPVSVTVDPTARVILTAHHTSPGRVQSFGINPISGLLSAGPQLVVGANPVSVAVAPTGGLAWVAHATSTFLTALRFDSSGGMTLVQNVSIGRPQRAVAVHPSGRFLYVLTDDGQIRIFFYDGGGFLFPLGDAPPAGGSPDALVVDPKGRFLFVADTGQNRIIPYVIQDGSLLVPFAAPQTTSRPSALAVEKTGRFLYAASESGSSVSGFAISPADGRLTFINTETGLTGAQSVSAEPSGRFLYVTRKQGVGIVTRLLINRANGALGGTPTTVPVGGVPIDLAVVHPGERFAFVRQGVTWQPESTSVAPFRIHPISGTLSPSAVVEGNVAVGLDSTGRFLFTLQRDQFGQVGPIGNNNVVTYQINLQTGALSDTLVLGLPGPPAEMATDPVGRFLFIKCMCTSFAGDIVTYAIHPNTGALTLVAGPIPLDPMPGVAFTGPMGVDPSGRFLYVSGARNGILAIAPDGTLRRVGRFDIRTLHLAIDPRGRSVFTAADDTITMHRRNPETGLIIGSETVPCPSPCPVGDLTSLAIDPSGRFLYAAIRDIIHLFRIDSGQLDPITAHQVGAGLIYEGLAVEASGRFLYATVSFGGQSGVHLLPLNVDSGTFLTESTVALLDQPTDIVTSGPMR
jgi:6-phosphogluconolactonase (cycloisomerase 2 family)